MAATTGTEACALVLWPSYRTAITGLLGDAASGARVLGMRIQTGRQIMHGAFILTTVTVGDTSAFSEYRAAVAQVNAKLGGDMLVRGAVQEVLEGDADEGDVVVALGFADVETARAYIASEDYAALAPLRERAGRFTIRVVA